MSKDGDVKTINVKVDVETKSKIDTLAYLQDTNLQELCITAIKEYVDKNADAIAEAEALRNKFKK